MSKKTLYGIVGVVIVVIVIISLATNKPSSSSSSTSASASNGSSSQPAAVAAVTVRQNMHDLIASGATKTCTFSMDASATSSALSGTVYMALGNMRGDFTKTSPTNSVTNSHMIITGGLVYLWEDAISKGYKLSWAVAASSTTMSDKAGGINFNEPTTYSCTNNQPDVSLFTLPSSVQFTDITAYVKAYGTKLPISK